jgi:hypothetical protein
VLDVPIRDNFKLENVTYIIWVFRNGLSLTATNSESHTLLLSQLEGFRDE